MTKVTIQIAIVRKMKNITALKLSVTANCNSFFVFSTQFQLLFQCAMFFLIITLSINHTTFFLAEMDHTYYFLEHFSQNQSEPSSIIFICHSESKIRKKFTIDAENKNSLTGFFQLNKCNCKHPIYQVNMYKKLIYKFFSTVSVLSMIFLLLNILCYLLN